VNYLSAEMEGVFINGGEPVKIGSQERWMKQQVFSFLFLL
jgi:hypothetical protein